MKITRRCHFLMLSILATSIVSTGPALAGSATNPADFNAFYAPSYKLPDPATATMNAAASRGEELFYSTYKYLGAESGILAANGKPYVGNKLACTNCHMDGGTRPHTAPVIVSSYKYDPAPYSTREGVNRTLPIRLNSCFERSMAGEALPLDSQWMKDMVAYIDYLGTGLQAGYTFTQVPGQLVPRQPWLATAADPVRGETIYKASCRSCHQDDGQGVWLADEKRYRYPALWGPNSFGVMAGTGQLATGMAVVYGSMPYDKVNSVDPSTRMPVQDAWDVTAYMLSKDRPLGAKFVNDWTGIGPGSVPNWLRRDPDASYHYTMPRIDGLGLASDDPRFPAMFPLEQHQYGPFQPIANALAKAKAYLGF